MRLLDLEGRLRAHRRRGEAELAEAEKHGRVFFRWITAMGVALVALPVGASADMWWLAAMAVIGGGYAHRGARRSWKAWLQAMRLSWEAIGAMQEISTITDAAMRDRAKPTFMVAGGSA